MSKKRRNFFALGGSRSCGSSVASAEDQFLFQLIVLKVKQCRGNSILEMLSAPAAYSADAATNVANLNQHLHCFHL